MEAVANVVDPKDQLGKECVGMSPKGFASSSGPAFSG